MDYHPEATTPSKIGRAPWEIRREVNTRLRDGQTGPIICDWLNSLPIIQAICAEHFAGEPVSQKNLGDYRTGAYKKWLANQAQIERTKDLAAYALNLAHASGGSLADGAAQLLAGSYMAAISAADNMAADGEDAPPAMPDHDAAGAVAKLRALDLQNRKLQLQAQALEVKNREVAIKEENAAWAFSAKLLTALRTHLDELRATEASATDDEAKMRDITRIVFGDDLLEKIELRRKEAQAAV